MRTLLVLVAAWAWSLSGLAFYVVHFTGEGVGDDRYADGSPLLEGECYAVLWQRDGVAFAGLRSDGSPVDTNNCEVVELLSGAEGAVSYVSNGTRFAGCAAYRKLLRNWDRRLGGSYSLYALDTRIWRNGRLVVGGVGSDGRLVALNAYSQVVLPGEPDGRLAFTASSDPDGASVAQAYDRPVSVAQAAVLPEDLPEPRFCSFSVADGVVSVGVSNTATCLGYGLAMAEELSGVVSATNFVGGFKQGEGAVPLTWRVDVPAGSRGVFFKVLRRSVADREE